MLKRIHVGVAYDFMHYYSHKLIIFDQQLFAYLSFSAISKNTIATSKKL